MSNLRLNITSGLLNKNYDFVGKMENYVFLKLTADGQTRQFRTQIVPGDKNKPISWNQVINIPIPRNSWSNARLDVEIRDQDMINDETCGKGFINLDHCGFFQQGATTPYKIKLYTTAKKTEPAGQLSFTSSFQ